MIQRSDPSAKARSGFALWVAAALMPLGGGLVAARAVDAVSAATAAWACVLALVLGWRAIKLGHRAVVTALVAGAGLCAGLAGVTVASLLDRTLAASLAAGVVCASAVVVAAGWGYRDAPGALRTLAAAAAVVTVASTVVAAALALGVQFGPAARVLPLAVVLALGPLARESVGAGGIAEALLRLRLSGRVDRGEIDRMVARAEEHFRGVVIGLAVVGGGAAAALVWLGEAVDVLLGLGFGLLLWLRSRLFGRLWHVLPLRLAALVVPLLATVRLLAHGPAWGPAVALLALAGLALVATTGVAGRRWRGRWLWFGEIAVVGAATAAAVTQG